MMTLLVPRCKCERIPCPWHIRIFLHCARLDSSSIATFESFSENIRGPYRFVGIGNIIRHLRLGRTLMTPLPTTEWFPVNDGSASKHIQGNVHRYEYFMPWSNTSNDCIPLFQMDWKNESSDMRYCSTEMWAQLETSWPDYLDMWGRIYSKALASSNRQLTDLQRQEHQLARLWIVEHNNRCNTFCTISRHRVGR